METKVEDLHILHNGLKTIEGDKNSMMSGLSLLPEGTVYGVAVVDQDGKMIGNISASDILASATCG